MNTHKLSKMINVIKMKLSGNPVYSKYSQLSVLVPTFEQVHLTTCSQLMRLKMLADRSSGAQCGP